MVAFWHKFVLMFLQSKTNQTETCLSKNVIFVFCVLFQRFFGSILLADDSLELRFSRGRFAKEKNMIIKKNMSEHNSSWRRFLSQKHPTLTAQILRFFSKSHIQNGFSRQKSYSWSTLKAAQQVTLKLYCCGSERSRTSPKNHNLDLTFDS